MYNRVDIRLTTHDAGGLSDKDMVLGKSITAIAAQAEAIVLDDRDSKSGHIMDCRIYVLAGFIKGIIGIGLPTTALALLTIIVTPA